jgi:hypothetical protein
LTRSASFYRYTHDLGTGQKDSNLYFELNVMLRVRVASGRDALKATWGGYMFYFVKGLAKLPNYTGECWRGYNHGTRAQILEQYSVGNGIQWGAFTSVATSRAAAENFAPETRVLFKITVTSGKTEIDSFCVRSVVSVFRLPLTPGLCIDRSGYQRLLLLPARRRDSAFAVRPLHREQCPTCGRRLLGHRSRAGFREHFRVVKTQPSPSVGIKSTVDY